MYQTNKLLLVMWAFRGLLFEGIAKHQVNYVY